MSITDEEHHVVVFSFPFSSHPSNLLGLVRRLAAAAPTAIFSFCCTEKVNRALFSVPISEKNIKPYAVHDGAPPGYVFSGKPLEAIDLFLEVADESYKAAMRAAEAETGKRISCVMSDAFMWFSGDVAAEMGVPWVAAWTSAASSLSVHFYTDLIRETVGIHGLAGCKNEILEFVPGFSKLRLSDLPDGVISGNLASPFSIMLHKMGRALPKATAIAINSFEEMDPEINEDLKSKLRNFLNVGPFSLNSLSLSSNLDEYGCIPWLDKCKTGSVAYIGFGTMAQPPPVEIVAMAEALEASDTPYLWSISEDSKQHLPEGFLKKTSKQGKMVPWAPQFQVLAHSSVGVFITHCGWNSVLEALFAGVPIIGRPIFADNALNMWRVENIWKIGVSIEGEVFTKSGTMNALESVLSEKGKELREQIGQFKRLALMTNWPEGSSTGNFNAFLKVVIGYNL
ncbi:Anthocyanidin 3-O-galactosyltransferase f3gt1 [Sarracenia purpurea var. burkii]